MSFQKLFSGGHLFVFVEYLCNRSPKIKTKNIKNDSSILAIVNHWNWLDDSPPLKMLKRGYFAGCRTVSNTGSGSGLAPAQNILAVQV